MKKTLIIVESPTKIKTLKKILPSGYIFESSVGHIRDLPRKEFGIDTEHGFEPKYVVLEEKKEVIRKLTKAARSADMVYLSPDPDREGEAIAWHILSILPAHTKAKRVTFNAFTKDTVLEALKHPRDIDQSLVYAQQARRLLDRMVGYKISPIITRRVRRTRDGGLSAGRVQSVALKLVVDREKEIESFQAVEYWNVYAELQGNKGEPSFLATLCVVDGKKVEKEPIDGKEVYLIPNHAEATALADKLQHACFSVDRVEKKERRRNPVAPFITSTLQQEASRHFGFSVTRTMSIAQTLYEGIDLEEHGFQGLITYMRTDSVRIAPDAIAGFRKWIQITYGSEYLPAEPRQYFTKKSAQDAHEAIRPTTADLSPKILKKYLTLDQHRLYTLIWNRMVASQMNPALYDTVSCDIMTDGGMGLRATGSVMKFAGFLAVYEEKQDGMAEGLSGNKEYQLPSLQVGQLLERVGVTSNQSFTKPLPRFTEASLVKALEELGIGRPSTYASIMQKIQGRDYTMKAGGSLKPTELGRVIAQMLEDNFRLIMDVGFTATMEDLLEQVAEDKISWQSLLSKFWNEFAPMVETAEKEAFVPKLLTDLICPKCGQKLQKIWARGRYFYGCSHYPNCDYTSSADSVIFSKEDYADDFDWDQNCSQCGGGMTVRFGRYGPFLGCQSYPQCRGIVNIPKKGDGSSHIQQPCIAIGCNGMIVARRSRLGRPFFSCSNYPSCDVIVNDPADLSTKYPDHPKTAYLKKSRSTKKDQGGKGNFLVTQELLAIVGEGAVSRGDVIRKMWEYIKKHHLQDPTNKRRIMPDDTLARVFGTTEPVDMMQIARLLKPHLRKS